MRPHGEPRRMPIEWYCQPYIDGSRLAGPPTQMLPSSHVRHVCAYNSASDCSNPMNGIHAEHDLIKALEVGKSKLHFRHGDGALLCAHKLVELLHRALLDPTLVEIAAGNFEGQSERPLIKYCAAVITASCRAGA